MIPEGKSISNNIMTLYDKIKINNNNKINSTSRSSRPTDVLWPCHTLLGSLACL